MKKILLILTALLLVILSLNPKSAPASASAGCFYAALTFDDGPHGVYTDMILDTLEENSAKATFFIMGQKIDSCLPQIRRILEEGHALGNHTMNHADLTLEAPENMKAQIYSVCKRTEMYFGTIPCLLRPPYGFFNDTVRESCGFPLILWSIDTLDWKTRSPEAICRSVADNIRDGDIILMHDIYPTTAEAVRLLLPLLREKGFKLVTVPELFHEKGIALEPGKAYFSASNR